MKITLYTTTSPKEQVDKVLSGSIDIECDLKAPASVLEPTLLLGGIDITGYNYAYIPDFKRYYHINEMETQLNTLNERSLTVDALYTYAAQIRRLKGIVTRQEKKYNLFLNDLQIPTIAYERVQTFMFPLKPLLKSPSIVLCTTGQGG